jgi:hypothetical protein
VGVPFGRPINPVTKGDWEGTGIEPDVKVSAADALTTAEKLAAPQIGKPEQAQVVVSFSASHNFSRSYTKLDECIGDLPPTRFNKTHRNAAQKLL